MDRGGCWSNVGLVMMFFQPWTWEFTIKYGVKRGYINNYGDLTKPIDVAVDLRKILNLVQGHVVANCLAGKPAPEHRTMYVGTVAAPKQAGYPRNAHLWGKMMLNHETWGYPILRRAHSAVKAWLMVYGPSQTGNPCSRYNLFQFMDL